MNKVKILKAIRIVIFLLFLIILFWLFNQNLGLTGRVNYYFSPQDRETSGLIEILQPSVLVKAYKSNSKFFLINSENLKFVVKPKRNFENLFIKFTLNNVSQERIDFYAQKKEEEGEFHEMIRNKFLDELNWPRISENDLSLWQRPAKKENDSNHIIYNSIDSFFKNPPPADEIGTFSFPAEKFYKIPDYKRPSDNLKIPYYFIGSEEILFYVEDECLDLSFDKIDLNRLNGADNLKVKLYLGDDLLQMKKIEDDGVIEATNRESQALKINFKTKKLPSGLYRLKIEGGNDLIFGNFLVNTRYFVFNNSLSLYKSNQKISIFSEGNRLIFKNNSSDDNSIILINQRVKVRKRSILKSDEEEKFNNLIGKTEIFLEKGEINLQGDKFIFSNFEFLPDKLVIFNDDEVIKNIDKINYIISPYKPKESLGIINFSHLFKTKELFQSDGKFYFNIRTPKVKGKRGKIELVSIQVTLFGKPLSFSEFLKLFKKLLRT